ncbi:MAG TPA: hypothetical protein VMV86_02465 [Methanosarcinales archaeon]|nr:hypothetical protein [Methanosarcinales archaeon]
MKIEDGKGKNGDMSVSYAQRGNVSSKSKNRLFYISRDDGLAFNAVMPSFSAAAGEYVFYLKNTSPTKNLMIDHIEYHSLQAVHWKVWQVTGTAAAGTAITPANLNLGTGIPAEATCIGGAATITGLTLGNQLGTHRTEATGEGEMDWGGGLILSPNTAIMVEYDTGTTGLCEIDCLFHFETIGAT